MSPCIELLAGASRHQAKTRMKCPIRIFPLCHPKAGVDVFVDGKRRIITLVCEACDRTISQIVIKKVKHARIPRPNQRPPNTSKGC